MPDAPLEIGADLPRLVAALVVGDDDVQRGPRHVGERLPAQASSNARNPSGRL